MNSQLFTKDKYINMLCTKYAGFHKPTPVIEFAYLDFQHVPLHQDWSKKESIKMALMDRNQLVVSITTVHYKINKTV